MAEVTAALVRDLREITGAGMMDCKRALTETAGDPQAAVDWLRKKGLAAAAKKAGRIAAEGLVGVLVDGTRGAIVEVNSETDFVARNEKFQAFVSGVLQQALDSKDVEDLSRKRYPGEGVTIGEKLTELIATVGENMSLRRMATFAVRQGAIGQYVHNALAPGLGKIGTLVALESADDKVGLAALGKQLAMHLASKAETKALSADTLDPAIIERERGVLTEQARASGRPEQVIAQMVEGRLRKFYEDVLLLEQTFVIDGESKIRQVLEKAGKENGTPIRITGFVRMALGEGVERAQ